MAVKSITLAARPNISRNKIQRRVAIQVTGNYTQGGAAGVAGETIDLTTMLNPAKFEGGKFAGVASSARSIPGNDEIDPSSSIYGYYFQLQQAAANPTLKNYVFQVFTSGGTELNTGAYPASLVGVDIVFTIEQGLKRA